MNHLQEFEIRLPKEFIHEHTPDWDNMDFKLWITVRYWYDKDNKLVLVTESLFDINGFIKWEHPRLKQYLIAACENNYENLHAGGISNNMNEEILN